MHSAWVTEQRISFCAVDLLIASAHTICGHIIWFNQRSTIHTAHRLKLIFIHFVFYCVISSIHSEIPFISAAICWSISDLNVYFLCRSRSATPSSYPGTPPQHQPNDVLTSNFSANNLSSSQIKPNELQPRIYSDLIRNFAAKYNNINSNE